jgi:hypothetical protein
MSAKALFAPGGHRWTPFDDVLMTLPTDLRTAATEVCWATIQCLKPGETQTNIDITDGKLAGMLDRSLRFVQKGLHAMQHALGAGLGMINRIHEEGRRHIVFTARFAGAAREESKPSPKAKAKAKVAPGASPVPNVPPIPATTREQLDAAAARIAESARVPEASPEEAARVAAEMKARAENFRRREAQEKARKAARSDRPAPKLTQEDLQRQLEVVRRMAAAAAPAPGQELEGSPDAGSEVPAPESGS